MIQRVIKRCSPRSPARNFGRLVAQDQLSGAQVDTMYRLLAANFDDVSRDSFQCDLDNKNWAILLEDQDRQLIGFSTLKFTRSVTNTGLPCTIIHSGDTIVSPHAWGSTVLPRTWLRSIRELEREHGIGPTYWLLICSGFRTYRFLSVFWKQFYPNCRERTPQPVQEFMNRLAEHQFGAQYDAETGIVRFGQPQILCDRLRDIPQGRTEDPHIAYFQNRNPGYVQGDELVCLTDVSDENLTRAGQRILGQITEKQ